MDYPRYEPDGEQSPREALDQAATLAHQNRAAARWLARYYLVFGVASAAMAVGVGLLQNNGGTSPAWLIVLMLAWAALIVALSVYSARQQTMVAGGGRLHLQVMTAWTVLWAITVAVGSVNALGWPWYLGGGLAMLVVSLIGAWVVARRTAAGTLSGDLR